LLRSKEEARRLRRCERIDSREEGRGLPPRADSSLTKARGLLRGPPCADPSCVHKAAPWKYASYPQPWRDEAWTESAGRVSPLPQTSLPRPEDRLPGRC